MRAHRLAWLAALPVVALEPSDKFAAKHSGRTSAEGSGLYVYKHDEAITGNPDFFSLFELRRTADGAYLLKDHSGGWLKFHTQEGEKTARLGIVGKVFASPPPPPPPMNNREHDLAMEAEAANRHALAQQAAEDAAAFAATATAAAEAEAERFYIEEQPATADGGAVFTLRLATGGGYIYDNPHGPLRQLVAGGTGAARQGSSMFQSSWWWTSGKAAAASSATPFNDSALFEFQRVVATLVGRAARRDAAPHTSKASTAKGGGRTARSFARRVRRSTMRVSGRDVVVTTYHNIGMLDWATLFWGWLAMSGIDRFMLLELDGVTCEAARSLNCTLQFECATANDMMLPERYTKIAEAGALAEWGTSAESAYFKFLRWKLRLVELVLEQGVDVIMIDVDVLVLSPSYLTTVVNSPYDLVISSDARQGSYNDNQHCPCSHPVYQRYSADWVCAGQFYMRSTAASIWFMREVQTLMDEYTITDQDAIQAMLTGHTQVAIPQIKAPAPNETDNDPRKIGNRPSRQWLKPLWLEGLQKHQSLANMAGSLPLNTPMKEGMWERTKERMAAQKFTWRLLPLSTFGNGPMLVDKWDDVFCKSAPQGSFLSIHANCWTKQWLTERRDTSKSFLFDDRVKRALPRTAPGRQA